ncbi:neuroligin-4, Y-linked-like [Dermatophagoides pteronyssinus]|uniref:Carboxylesterase 5A-like n=1 Tax=Dermatophagoides pteronyssinus TaxID=6956 RepID=A0A6P6YJ53_DERPT|nr:carboxylesterase 5A-like [Dermatophagoides pteronyssinus]
MIMESLFIRLLFGLCPLIIMVTGAGADSIQMNPIVSTTSGRLIGQKTLIHNGDGEIYQFFGIPYAQPPIGENRFEKPKELSTNSSEQLLLAKQLKPTCMQMKHLAKTINPLLDLDEIHNISEDCLYLNIYVPIVEQKDLPLPVMVWIPGEGYDFADARQFDGSYLASIGKVIVITVQYRVGVFGFLKNNAGIWDQLMALKWIKQNIGEFGGNVNDITVFGRFSGSMSISILLSSKYVIEQQQSSLFNRAILMSGIAVGNWVFDNKHDDKIEQFLSNQGCNNIDCMKIISAKQILDTSGYGWKPFIDTDLIEDKPLDAVRKGKFAKNIQSIMLGTNQFEGNLCLIKHLAMDESFYGKLIQNNISQQEFERIIHEDLQMFYGDDYHVNNYRANVINNRDNYVKFCSELLIDSHMQEYQNILQQRIYYDKNYRLRNIYRYKVDYKPSFSIAPEFINSSIHGDDVLLAFGLAFKNPYISNENDQQISKQMIELFSEFARNGQPKSITNNGFIEIKSESKFDNHNCQQWKQLKENPILALTFISLAIIFICMLIFACQTLIKQQFPFNKQQTCQQMKHLLQQQQQC